MSQAKITTKGPNHDPSRCTPTDGGWTGRYPRVSGYGRRGARHKREKPLLPFTKISWLSQKKNGGKNPDVVLAALRGEEAP